MNFDIVQLFFLVYINVKMHYFTSTYQAFS